MLKLALFFLAPSRGLNCESASAKSGNGHGDLDWSLCFRSGRAIVPEGFERASPNILSAAPASAPGLLSF